jgi:hypothetical protein
MYGIRSQILAISLLAGLAPVQTCWAQSQLPERGLDKSTVETRLGAPQRVEGPVGEPPITKWIYADYIVVFEYDHVVHTVKRQAAVEQAPVSGGTASPSNQTTSPFPVTTPPAADPAAPATESSPVSEPSVNSSAPAAAGSESGITPDSQTTGDTLSIPQ